MSKSRASGQARRYSYPIDNAWRTKIQALMTLRGITQRELARRIGASPPLIVLLFKPSTMQSTFVAPIHKVLGLVAPTITKVIEAP